ncbi:hypothetical protein GCM10010441_72320 [Kitasatospora paracochleata]|uniref:WD40 repeat protein n=1 Tax=Kitasatospora paracochleata TaxID=58354 RepID=A0ABT1J955_9ACTN|nr:NB-ARC domain-containing protein [Kitasatospora paracochleata]MCP2313972.1 WD40 repeat protein [Kitasatospora paracochleata]
MLAAAGRVRDLVVERLLGAGGEVARLMQEAAAKQSAPGSLTRYRLRAAVAEAAAADAVFAQALQQAAAAYLQAAGGTRVPPELAIGGNAEINADGGGFAAAVAHVHGGVQIDNSTTNVFAGDGPASMRDGLGPPPPPVLESWLVPRAELTQAVEAVLTDGGTVGLTTSLHGAGGFGKTRLARMVCADARVRAHFGGRVYRVTIGRDVRNTAEIASKVTDVIRQITDDDRPHTDPEAAGTHLGRLLGQQPSALLMIDDVWQREQVEPFLIGAPGCVRLVTTRRPSIVDTGGFTRLITVDRMTEAEARHLLLQDLDTTLFPTRAIDELIARTGRMPLNLRQVNRTMVKRVRLGMAADRAAMAVLERLRVAGPAAVDEPGMNAAIASQRERALAATIEAALELLPPGGRDRCLELGVFAEDEAVPVPLVCRLWAATAGISEDQAYDLLSELVDLSLITVDSSNGGRISLHDVHRDYLRHTLGESELTHANLLLVEAVTANLLPVAAPLTPGAPDPGHAWWDTLDRYVLDHAVEHLLAADRLDTAEALATDLRWIDRRLHQRGPTAPIADLLTIGSPDPAERAGDLAQAAHLLQHTHPDHSLTSVLHSRLDHHPHWRTQITAHADLLTRPRLSNHSRLPDIPHPALLRTLTGRTGTVRAVAISSDGTWLATTGANDRTVRIWDHATATQTAVLVGHDFGVNAVAISPDGSWLATTGANDRTVRIWDRATATQTAVLVGHTGAVNAVAISPDGSWLATTGDDQTVRIWDRATATQTAVLVGHTGAVNAVAISPDGTWLATAGDDQTVRIWDRATATQTAILTGHTGTVNAVAISPDGTWLATAGDDQTVRIWDRATATQTAPLTDHDFWVNALAISSDLTWLATASKARSVHIRDRATATETAILTGHDRGVSAVAISPDGTWLATTSDDGTARLWNPTTATQTATLTGHTNKVNAVAISPDGTWLATTGHDETVRIWDHATATQTAILTGHDFGVRAVAISPDGTWLATAGHDETVRIWDRATGIETAILVGHDGTVNVVAISPDGTLLATAGDDRTVRVWDRATGIETVILTGHDFGVRAVAISPDGTWLATAGHDETVRIWDRATGIETAILTGHDFGVRAVAISPDGTWLATTGDDETVRIWDRATATQTAILTGHTGTVNAVAISPDGTWLATTGNDGTVRVWNAISPAPLAMMRTENSLTSCSWSSDSRSIAVGSDSGLYYFDFHPGT